LTVASSRIERSIVRLDRRLIRSAHVSTTARVFERPDVRRFSLTLVAPAAPTRDGARSAPPVWAESFASACVQRHTAFTRVIETWRHARTVASAFSDSTRIFARLRAIDLSVDQPATVVRRESRLQTETESTRTTHQRVREEEVLLSVRRTIAEESERLTRQLALQTPSPQHLADDVYGRLTRRLVVERERLGR
jgi:hypothetical protein